MVMLNPAIRWALPADDPSLLVNFFLLNVSEEYISHGEIQDGRADDPKTWSKNINSILIAEFSEACSVGSATNATASKIALAVQSTGETAAFALLQIRRDAQSPYAILHDILVHRGLRGHGIGTQLLEWIQVQLHALGVQFIFLESGASNERAHEFFEKNGFSPISTNFMKSLR